MPITYTKIGFDYLRRIPTSNRAALRRAMEATAIDMTAEIRKTISRPYPPASAPGTPPHRRTGNLRASVQLRVIGRSDKAAIGAYWGEMVEYAPHLEFGTVNMSPRPFMHPILHGRGQRQKWQARTVAYLKEELSRSMRPRDRRMANFFGRGKR